MCEIREEIQGKRSRRKGCDKRPNSRRTNLKATEKAKKEKRTIFYKILEFE